MAGLQYYFFPTDFYYPRPPAASAPSASIEATTIKAAPGLELHQPSKGNVAVLVDNVDAHPGSNGQHMLQYGKAGSVPMHNVKQKLNHVRLLRKQDHEGKHLEHFIDANKVTVEI